MEMGRLLKVSCQQKKNNAEFPAPLMVKKEIIHMCKGLFVATLCPAITLMMTKYTYSIVLFQ